MNDPASQKKRLAWMISGITDTLLGATLLIIGFGLLPIDVTKYGFQNWHLSLLGAILFILGLGIFAYNFSRLHE